MMALSISSTTRYYQMNLKRIYSNLANATTATTHPLKIKTLTNQNQSLAEADSSTIKWKSIPSFSFNYYQQLSKSKLASFVVLTTMAGYAISPGVLDLSTLLSVTIGTALCVTSANSFNQWTEVPFDSQMSRTRNRVLVRHYMSPRHAFTFAGLSGLMGIYGLYHFVNPLTALLGAANILLYAGIYTPLKRFSISNTWVGAIVGAIPPIMGWTAATGSFGPEAWILGGILFSWQFPHFNSLAWNLRSDYARAGYHMMSVLNPSLNARVSLRHSLYLFPLSFGAYFYGLASIYFLGTSSIVNSYMTWRAFEFWKASNDITARRLFFASLIHLPLFLCLLLFHKVHQQEEEVIHEQQSKSCREK